MSGAPAPTSVGRRFTQAFGLLALFGLMYGVTRVVPFADGRGETAAAVGFLLLGGTLMSQLLEIVGAPHLSGYLFAGALAGPYLLHLIGVETVEQLTKINALALALIALEGGAQLKLDTLRKGLRSLSWALVMQTLPVALTAGAVVLVARPLIPFLRPLSPWAILGVSVLWGALAMARSPAAVLGVLSQTRAEGPMARFTLTFVMASNIVVVVLVAFLIMLARPLIEPTEFSFVREVSRLGHDLFASVALGTTLGLVLAAYLRFIGKQLLVVYVALGFGMTEVLGYLRLDALLTFMVAGFVVANLSKQADKLTASIADAGTLIYVVFFATAGAHLDIPLLKKLWPVALLFVGSRAVVTYIAARIGSRLADDVLSVRRWGWSGLIAQAGLALGVANVIAQQFPSFGEGFRSLAIATAALNEIVGPILFKLALDRSGESSKTPREVLASLAPT